MIFLAVFQTDSINPKPSQPIIINARECEVLFETHAPDKKLDSTSSTEFYLQWGMGIPSDCGEWGSAAAFLTACCFMLPCVAEALRIEVWVGRNYTRDPDDHRILIDGDDILGYNNLNASLLFGQSREAPIMDVVEEVRRRT